MERLFLPACFRTAKNLLLLCLIFVLPQASFADALDIGLSVHENVRTQLLKVFHPQDFILSVQLPVKPSRACEMSAWQRVHLEPLTPPTLTSGSCAGTATTYRVSIRFLRPLDSAYLFRLKAYLQRITDPHPVDVQLVAYPLQAGTSPWVWVGLSACLLLSFALQALGLAVRSSPSPTVLPMKVSEVHWRLDQAYGFIDEFQLEGSDLNLAFSVSQKPPTPRGYEPHL